MHTSGQYRQATTPRRVRARGTITLLVAVTACVLFTASAQAAPSHATVSHSRVLAQTFMQPGAGGYLSTRRGVAINVPANVMSRPGYVKITSLGRGVYNVHIDVPWHGSVQITVPLRSGRDRVLHDVGGTWLVESKAPGQATVTVTQLSSFTDSIGKLANKVAGKLCLTTVLVDLIECVGDHLDSKLTSWVESKLPHNCAIELIEGGDPLGVAKQATRGDCTGQAGETPVPPSTPAPSPPSTPAPPSRPNPTSPPSTPAPPSQPNPPPTSTEGFFIEDSIYGGTWARTDPGDGTWYAHGSRPANGAYWYPNGLGVAVSCAESAASYSVVVNGAHSTWSWWAHVTDGKWVPTVVFSSVWSDGLPAGLAQC